MGRRAADGARRRRDREAAAFEVLRLQEEAEVEALHQRTLHVRDDGQSIYRFRGAAYAAFRQFDVARTKANPGHAPNPGWAPPRTSASRARSVTDPRRARLASGGR